MAHSTHANLTADERGERNARRRSRPPVRRQATRSAVILAALAEETDQ